MSAGKVSAFDAEERMVAIGPIDESMTVDALMRRWPPTIRVVLRYGMLCVGCPIGRFHTIAEACRAHQVNESRFAQELARIIEAEKA